MGLPQRVAAELALRKLRTWQDAEAGKKRLDPAAWAMFLLRIGAIDLEDIPCVLRPWQERRRKKKRKSPNRPQVVRKPRRQKPTFEIVSADPANVGTAIIADIPGEVGIAYPLANLKR